MNKKYKLLINPEKDGDFDNCLPVWRNFILSNQNNQHQASQEFLIYKVDQTYAWFETELAISRFILTWS